MASPVATAFLAEEAVVYAIVSEHGGEIELDETRTGGARFVVRLPLGRAGDVEPLPSASEHASQPEGARVVLTDTRPAADDEAERLASPEGGGMVWVHGTNNGKVRVKALVTWAAVLPTGRLFYWLP